MATPEKLIKIITTLAEAYGRKLGDLGLEAYRIALEDVDDLRLEMAAVSILKQPRQFMPSPGEIRELALTSGHGYRQLAEQAWQQFDRQNGQTDDPLAQEILRSNGGWQRVGQMRKEEYYEWFRKRFVESYQQLLQLPRGAQLLEVYEVRRIESPKSKEDDQEMANIVKQARQQVTGPSDA